MAYTPPPKPRLGLFGRMTARTLIAVSLISVVSWIFAAFRTDFLLFGNAAAPPWMLANTGGGITLGYYPDSENPFERWRRLPPEFAPRRYTVHGKGGWFQYRSFSAGSELGRQHWFPMYRTYQGFPSALSCLELRIL